MANMVLVDSEGDDDSSSCSMSMRMTIVMMTMSDFLFWYWMEAASSIRSCSQVLPTYAVGILRYTQRGTDKTVILFVIAHFFGRNSLGFYE
jgi:hypothetical protein